MSKINIRTLNGIRTAPTPSGRDVAEAMDDIVSAVNQLSAVVATKASTTPVTTAPTTIKPTNTATTNPGPGSSAGSGSGGGGSTPPTIEQVVAVTGNYTMGSTDYCIEVTATANCTIQLLGVQMGTTVSVKNYSATGIAVTIEDSSGGTIDNLSSFTESTENFAATFIYDGTSNWIVVAPGDIPQGVYGAVQYNNNGELGGAEATILDNQLLFYVGYTPVAMGDLLPSFPGMVAGFGVGNIADGTGSFLIQRSTTGGPIMQVGDGSTAYATASFADPLTLNYISGAPNFQLIPVSNTVNTALGLGYLLFGGSSSGSAKIQVASAAGTPNPLQLPTTTGSNGQVLTTDGGNPQQLSWTTPSSGGVTSFTGDGTVLSNSGSTGAVTATLETQSANTVLAGPTSGSAAAPTFRSLSTSDLPANPSTPVGLGFIGGASIGKYDTSDTAGQLLYNQNPGDLVAFLFYLEQAITITHIAVEVTAANGSATTFDCGLYTAAGSLVANTAGFNGNSATLQNLAVAQSGGSVALTAGWYYLAWCTEGSSTSTMRANGINLEGSNSFIYHAMNLRGVNYGYKAQASGNSWNSTGILPSTLPTLAAVPTIRPQIMAFFSA